MSGEEDPIMDKIQQLSNRNHVLYRELGRIIESGLPHAGDDQSQMAEIRKNRNELTRLWQEERARGHFWMPRLGTSKHSGPYERQLQKGAHGYG